MKIIVTLKLFQMIVRQNGLWSNEHVHYKYQFLYKFCGYSVNSRNSERVYTISGYRIDTKTNAECHFLLVNLLIKKGQYIRQSNLLSRTNISLRFPCLILTRLVARIDTIGSTYSIHGPRELYPSSACCSK